MLARLRRSPTRLIALAAALLPATAAPAQTPWRPTAVTPPAASTLPTASPRPSIPPTPTPEWERRLREAVGPWAARLDELASHAFFAPAVSVCFFAAILLFAKRSK